MVRKSNAVKRDEFDALFKEVNALKQALKSKEACVVYDVSGSRVFFDNNMLDRIHQDRLVVATLNLPLHDEKYLSTTLLDSEEEVASRGGGGTDVSVMKPLLKLYKSVYFVTDLDGQAELNASSFGKYISVIVLPNN